jgi:hypothetical protein
MDHGEGGHGGMQMAHPSTGLASSEQGYTFDSSITTLPAGSTQEYSFRILKQDGKVQKTFAEDRTKLMHFYAIRRDLTGYQHLHPEMASDGTWRTKLEPAAPGPHRVYASSIVKDDAGKQHSLVLSREMTVPGGFEATPLPAQSSDATADGYTVNLQGQLASGRTSPFKLRMTRDGQPVRHLEPYLGTYAHLTAFRSGDLAFAHLHPKSSATGSGGGPELEFDAELPGSGDYRLFIQFQTEGQLHTAALTTKAT